MFFLDLTRDTILAPLGLLPYTSSFFFELIDIIIMSFVLGYIFSDFIGRPGRDPLDAYKKSRWQQLKVSALVAGPAVVFHELAHKFVAMAFGAQAVLYAPYGWYLLVIILKAIGFPFMFLVGAFVAHSPLPPLESSIVALAGPALNFLMWGAAILAVKAGKVKPKYLPYVVPFARLNLLLGIFNMLPIPGFDGFGFFAGLFQALF
ncbi:MAG: M50 family metallopeptidase [Nanoarchaeota archaeon]|nr:M50 family metallopeptidase [Nanoarchaeota archaeon]